MYRLGFRFQTQWLHCTMQNMFILHRLGQESKYKSVPESVSGSVNEPLVKPNDPMNNSAERSLFRPLN